MKKLKILLLSLSIISIKILAQTPTNDGYLDVFYKSEQNVYVMFKEDKRGVFGNPHNMVVNIIAKAKSFAETHDRILEEVSQEFHPMGILGDWASFTYKFRLLTESSQTKLGNEELDVSQNSESSQNIMFSSFNRDSKIEIIFILPVEGKDCEGNISSSQNIASLTESLLLGKYDILDRRQFEQVADEHKPAATGLLLQETVIERGCDSGSQGVVFTEVGCLDGQKTINIKLVGCQSSKIYWSCLGINASSLSVINQVIENLSK